MIRQEIANNTGKANKHTRCTLLEWWLTTNYLANLAPLDPVMGHRQALRRRTLCRYHPRKCYCRGA